MEDFWKKRWGNKIFWATLLLLLAMFAYSFQPIRMFETPYKVGEVTLFSMLILCLIGYFYGPKYGFISCFLFGVIIYILDVVLGYSPFRFSEGLDYVLGYTLLGFCGLLSIIPNKNGKKRSFLFCFSIAIALRFMESVWIWSWFRDEPVSFWNDLWYGIINCLGYIGIEYLLSIIILLLSPVKKALKYLNLVATEKYNEKYDFF